MSMKETLISIAELNIKMLDLCVNAFGKKGITKGEYAKILMLAKELLKLTEELP